MSNAVGCSESSTDSTYVAYLAQKQCNQPYYECEKVTKCLFQGLTQFP